jgi:hypothetical protein
MRIFYNTFKGYTVADDDEGNLIIDKSYTYCGIDKSTNKAYFYQATNSDSGTEGVWVF